MTVSKNTCMSLLNNQIKVTEFNFPIIDKFTQGANDIAACITSIKSMDLAVKTYQKAGQFSKL